MQIGAIVDFWRGQQKPDHNGRWTHSLDRPLLDAGPHSFNLDYPVSPYVGAVLTAPVVMISSNAGYDSDKTPTEFPDAASIHAYVACVDEPAGADWKSVSRYYDKTNYGKFIDSGQAVLINATPYRSPMLSDEPDNIDMLPRLPTSIFNRDWLLQAVLPLAAKGERLIVVKRGIQRWQLPSSFPTSPGVIVEPNPRFSRFGKERIRIIEKFLVDMAQT